MAAARSLPRPSAIYGRPEPSKRRELSAAVCQATWHAAASTAAGTTPPSPGLAAPSNSPSLRAHQAGSSRILPPSCTKWILRSSFLRAESPALSPARRPSVGPPAAPTCWSHTAPPLPFAARSLILRLMAAILSAAVGPRARPSSRPRRLSTRSAWSSRDCFRCTFRLSATSWSCCWRTRWCCS